jgi:hypothetical protein
MLGGEVVERKQCVAVVRQALDRLVVLRSVFLGEDVDRYFRIALLERFWQARHPPRYAAYLIPSSPSFPHSSAPDAKGYKRGQFEDAWARYLSLTPQKSDFETSNRPNTDGTRVSGDSRPVRDDAPDGSDNGDLSNNHGGLDAWTDRKAGSRSEGHPDPEIEDSILPGMKVAI